MKIRLSKLQAEECQHKFSILCDEPDLQEEYGITQDQADELLDGIPKDGWWEIPEWATAAVRGELADHANTLRAIAENARQGDDTGQMLSNYRLAKKFDEMSESEDGNKDS